MSAQAILEAAIAQSLRDEANGVELFPAYNRLKQACEQALESLVLHRPKPLPLSPTVVVSVRIAATRIVESVCWASGVSRDELMSERRTARVAQARHAAMFLLRKHTAMTLDEVGDVFCNRDHATVLHGVRAVQAENGNGPRSEIIARAESALLPQTQEVGHD